MALVLFSAAIVAARLVQTAATPRLTLGAPVQVGRIAIVPIEATIPLSRDKYLTLDEATKRGVIQIVEIPGQEEVNELEVHNRADLPVLLFAGELLLGGKQDRIVAKDSIVPALGRCRVPVYCVEHGRWEGQPQFKSGETFVPDQVRAAATNESSQTLVWDQVARSNATAHAAPTTGTLRGTLFDAKIQEASKRVARELVNRFRPDEHTIGMICWLDGKIESADIFANPRLFAANCGQLLKSYTVDAELAPNRAVVPVKLGVCQAFLARIVSARRVTDAMDRTTRNYRLHDRSLYGVESGAGRFSGGLSAGFNHGNYRPNDPNQSAAPPPRPQIRD